MRRLRALIVDGFPECVEEHAWVGVRWRVGQATIAHVFGGEDGRFRITFRAEPDEVMAFQHLGPPYFKADWGRNVVGIVLDAEHRLVGVGRAVDRLLLRPGAGAAGKSGAPAGVRPAVGSMSLGTVSRLS